MRMSDEYDREGECKQIIQDALKELKTVHGYERGEIMNEMVALIDTIFVDV